MTYEVDYIIKVLNPGVIQSLKDTAAAVNLLGPGVQVLDRLNKRITALNKSLNNKTWKLKLNTTDAETKLTKLEAHLDKIRQKASGIGVVMSGGKNSSTSSKSKGSTSTGGTRPSAPPTGYFGSGKTARYYGSKAPVVPAAPGMIWTPNGALPIPKGFEKQYERAFQRQSVARNLQSQGKNSKLNRAFRESTNILKSSRRSIAHYDQMAQSHAYQSLTANNEIARINDQLQAQRAQTASLAQQRKQLKQQDGSTRNQSLVPQIKGLKGDIAASMAKEAAMTARLGELAQIRDSHSMMASAARRKSAAAMTHLKRETPNNERLERALARQRQWVADNLNATNPYTTGYSQTPMMPLAPPKPPKAKGSAKTPKPLAPPKPPQFNLRPNNLQYKLFGPTPLTNNGGMAIDMLKGMGIAYGIAGIGQFMSSMITDAVAYDNTITTVKNILQSNEGDSGFYGRFFGMQKIIREVGKKTRFKVTEVADAARFLAMAGYKSDAITSAIPSIADIALIGDTDLGETADLMTNVMTAYNISPRKMRNTADIMTRTFTKANVTLPEIAESYKYAGSLLSAGGVDFEEATAGIGILGDAGIKGSQAGTTMRTIMSNITNPRGKLKQQKWASIGVSRTDENGNVKSLNQIFNELYDKHLTVADFYQLFDKTAAQGAVALTMHVKKWNEVIKANFMSDGLSEDLADEKKNTIQGLWAQLTSSLADDGLGGFGAIQENVKVLLRSLTTYLNSDAGKDKIVEIFNAFWKFVDVISNATTYLFSFFDKFSGIIMFWMRVQLAIWPLVKTFTTLKSVLLSLSGIGRMVGLIGTLSMSLRNLMVTMGSFRVLGSVLWDWLASTLTGGVRGRKYSFTPAGIVRNQPTPNLWNGNYSYTTDGTGIVMSPNGTANPQSRPKANRAFWKGHKGAMWGTGIAGVAGMALGGLAGHAIGGYLGGDTGSMVGSMVGGVGGAALMTSVGSWLSGAAPALFTNPVGWGVLAVGAVAAVTYAIIKANKAVTKANEQSKEWAKTVHNLYLDQIDWSKDTAIETANLRVTQGLLSQNEALRAGIANWDAWWKARNGPEDKPAEFKPAETAWGIKMNTLIDQADTAYGRNEVWRNRWNQMFPGMLNGNTFSVPGVSLTIDGKVGQDDALKLAFMERGTAMGTDPNKEDYNPFYASAAHTFANKIWGLDNYGEWDSLTDTWVSEIVPDHNASYDNIDLSTTKSIKDNILAVGSVKWFRDATLENIRKEREKYRPLVNLLNNFQTNGTADFGQMNNALFRLYNPFFGSSFGVFGTDEWKQNMADYMHTADGRINSANVAKVLHVWERLNNAFDTMRPAQKALLQPYLQRDLWTSILPEGVDLPDGGLVSGTLGSYTFNTANEKFVRKAWTNPYGQQTSAWFRVNADGSVATTPYWGTDLQNNIGAVTRIPFSNTVFNPAPNNNQQPLQQYPYIMLNDSVVGRNPHYIAPSLSLYLNQTQSPYLPTFNWQNPRNYQFPSLGGNVSSADYRPNMVVHTDKPVAQGNQLIATNAVGTVNFNLYTQGPTTDQIQSEIRTQVPILLTNCLNQAANTVGGGLRT